MCHLQASCLSCHRTTASIKSLQTPAKSKDGLLWPATKAFGQERSKMTNMDPPRLRWGSEVHQRKRKREKITFEATETESRNWLFFFSLINCTGSTSALAEPARTLHLPITWYLGEVEEPAKPSCSPPSYLPCGMNQFSTEGVFKVRNRRSEAKIGSNQSWASASPTEGQMGERQLMMLLESFPFSYPSWTFCFSHA